MIIINFPIYTKGLYNMYIGYFISHHADPDAAAVGAAVVLVTMSPLGSDR